MFHSLHKKRLFGFLFFCYFNVYAISPLTYTFPEKKAGDCAFTPTEAAARIKNARLFLWEFILEKVAAAEESAPDHAREIIIRKKRALLPENTAATLLSFDAASIAKNRFTPPLPIVVPAVERDAVHGKRESFSSLYAGHSPPTA